MSTIVEFDRVGLRYGTGAEILRDLDFRLQRGAFYFLTGPSGAGKTSLLKLLYLALMREEKEWKMPPREWSKAKAQFAILFGERFTRAMA